MGLTVLTTNSVGTGNRVTLGSGESLYVAEVIRVESSNGAGIVAGDGGHTVTVDGTVLGSVFGVSLGGFSDGVKNTLLIGAEGNIGSQSVAVDIYGAGSRVENAGTVFSNNTAIRLGLDGSAISTIVNTGKIIAANVGITRASFADDGQITLINKGTLIGGTFAYLSPGSISVDVIRNTGLIQGDIVLDQGNDRYDGRGGKVLGLIFAGEGADRLIGGTGAERFFADEGADRLTGGKGNDAFVFENAVEAKDVITDFSNAKGNNDHFECAVFGFGGGLAVGTLAASQFVTRADNKAQDADDRFIFRTTDRTLWYDENGSAAGGRHLIADLQAGAVVTAADILLI